VSDPQFQKRLEKFLEMLRSTEHWLDRHFSQQMPSKIARIVLTLRAYLKHCRRGANRANIATLRRQREKIQDACYFLWQSARPDR
jgi:hypothetical protein